jgi:hypothetical protein
MWAVAQILFERSPQTVQKWISLVKALVLLPRSLWLYRCDFETEAGPGVYLGEGLSFEYLQTLLGGRLVQRKRVPLWHLRKVGRAAGTSVTLVEVNRLLAKNWLHGGWDSAPWVCQEVDLAGARYQSRRQAIEATWGRKVRQQRFECRESSLPCDLERFHREFYLPWLRLRFGEAVTGRSLASLQLAMRAGFLLQVWDGDNWIAGMVVVRQGPNRVAMLAPALRPQSENRLKDGALSAAYYFLVRWARDQRVRFVNLGGSRPSLQDGVFQHKARWGADPKPDPWHHTSIRFYVDAAGPVPDAVWDQLVERDGRLEPLGRGIKRWDACARKQR